MGGGTWIYLGTFEFEDGREPFSSRRSSLSPMLPYRHSH